MAFKRHVVTRVRRKSVWIPLLVVQDTQASAGSQIIGSFNASALALRPFTIVRIHLELMIKSDQAAAIEDQAGAYGVAVVSDQAVAVGITGVPLPNTDAESSLWMLHQFIMGSAQELTDLTVGPRHYSLDSKAMRKVDAGQDVVFVLENSLATGMIVTSAARLLVKTN